MKVKEPRAETETAMHIDTGLGVAYSISGKTDFKAAREIADHLQVVKVKELRAELIAKAKELGLVVNERMVALIEEAAENDRQCHCDHDRRCPCEHISADVARWGACLCRVLATPAYMEARAKRDAAPKKPKKKGKPKRRELTKAEKKLIGKS